jgi:hypothetical protein
MMVDSGATGMFMDRTFARIHNFDVIDLENPRTVAVIDGREIVGGQITQSYCADRIASGEGGVLLDGFVWVRGGPRDHMVTTP